MTYIPEQGDIIWLNFDPSSGKEIMKMRPAFVISRNAFNEHTKIRGIKLEIVLSDKTKTKGAILVYQLKSIDFMQRDAKFIEKTPSNIVKQVLSVAQLLVQ